MGKWELSRE